MSQTFEIRIGAVDNATKVFRKINAGLSSTFRPAIQAQRQFGALIRETHIDKIAKGLSSASRASMKFARGMGVLTAPLESLFSLGAAGGIAGGIGGVGAVILGLGAKWGAMGFEINRTSQTIGVSTDKLQLYRGIAQMAGLSTESMTTAMANLGETLHGLLWNGNAEVQTTLAKLGITIKKTPEGVVDTTAALVDLSRAISRVADPHTQFNIAKVFGLEELLPLLRQGPEAVEALGRAVRQTGYVMGGQAIKDADAYGEAINRLKLTAEAAVKVLGVKFLPVVNFATRFLQAGIDVRKPAWGGASGSWGDDDGPRRGGASGSWGDDGTPTAQSGAAASRGTPEQRALLAKLEAQNGLPKGMLTGIWGTESSFGRNTGLSSAGARGNFQFMPGTARQYGVNVGDFESEATGAAAYLRDLYAQKGSWKGALYAYNGVVNNKAAGDKYVSDVARNGDAQPLKIELQINGAPTWMTAKAKSATEFIPTRINYSMPAGGMP